MSIWKNLRERRIIQIFVAYMAAGWVALGVLDQFADRQVVPELMYKLALVAFLAGIPASLILGWYHGEKGAQKATLSEVLLLAVVAIGGIGAGVTVINANTTEDLADVSTLDLSRIAVLYFEDAGLGEEQAFLADGLTEALIDQLAQVSGLDVVSRNGVAPFRDTGLAPDSLARTLQAGTLITGSLEPAGDDLRVSVRLLDGASGTDIHRESFDWPAENLLAIREDLASETALLLREWLGEEVRLRERRAGTTSVPAWVLLQRAERERKTAEALASDEDFEGAFLAFSRADSLLDQAVNQDTAWAEPVALKAQFDYRRSRLSYVMQDLAQTVEWARRGLDEVDHALGIESNHARALEIRGTLRYWTWLLNVTPDPAARDRLFETAQADLERAVQIEPALASAHGTLSHLYYGDDIASAVLAARKAYEEDAYLDNADVILWRLFNGSYDMAQFTQAQRWCDEGARRFSGDYRFTLCQLLVMTMPASEPDVGQAWSALARLDTVSAPEYQRVYAEIIVGGILGRAGLRDSSASVLLRARAKADPQLDPTQELLSYEAAMRVIAGDQDEAIELLKRYIAANPDHAFDPQEEMGWWWRPLQDHPRFRELISAP
jgi:serine/threonine-protein kinase